MKKRVFSVLLTSILAMTLLPALAACSTGSGNTLGEPISTSTITDFPQVVTTTLEGDAVTGSGLMGEKLTVVNIWATWCSPCIEELPYLQQVSEQYASQGIMLLGVMQDGTNDFLEPDNATIEAGIALLNSAGATYANILPDITLHQSFISTMQYFPTTFFLNSEGEVIKTIIGSRDAAGWASEIEQTLAELG